MAKYHRVLFFLSIALVMSFILEISAAGKKPPKKKERKTTALLLDLGTNRLVSTDNPPPHEKVIFKESDIQDGKYYTLPTPEQNYPLYPHQQHPMYKSSFDRYPQAEINAYQNFAFAHQTANEQAASMYGFGQGGYSGEQFVGSHSGGGTEYAEGSARQDQQAEEEEEEEEEADIDLSLGGIYNADPKPKRKSSFSRNFGFSFGKKK